MRLGQAHSPAALAGAFRDALVAQSDRWSLWSAVVFGLGCAAYFALPREPALPVAAADLALAAGLLILARR
ncbi:MAG TPA: hypothetical protein PKA17_08610, partial [Phenylobacterium sp.]|nr:hypothetical protein [Phenylobacterium sp.]